MNTIITGASGLIGSSLLTFLEPRGHRITRMVRKRSSGIGGDILWDPQRGAVAAQELEGFDAVVHLAGENIASGRWTADKKRRIRQSRVEGTRLLAESLARVSSPPRVMVCASAIGYYGDRKEELLSEGSPPGRGFLADVCREWEKAAEPAAARGIRLVNLRIGVVLSSRGGALKRMILPFRLGLGGKVGSGRQFMSWIALEDLLEIIDHVIRTENLSGAVNAVAPNPVTNLEFTQTLAKSLSRPAFFAVPAFALRLGLGEMAEELLLASTRVHPGVLQASDYEFLYPRLEEALRHILD